MHQTDPPNPDPSANTAGGNQPDQHDLPQPEEDRQPRRQQLRYRIHFEHSDGTEDSFDVEGSEQECVEMALAGIQRRNGKNPWSRQLPCGRLP